MVDIGSIRVLAWNRPKVIFRTGEKYNQHKNYVRSVVAGTSACRAVAADSRMSCGYPAIWRNSCLRRGCCWDPTVFGTPACYHHRARPIAPSSRPTYTIKQGRNALPEPNCDVGHDRNQQDCGFPGITQYTCRQRGCCWNSSVQVRLLLRY